MELSHTDNNRLMGVHPSLVKVVQRAASITEVPFKVIEGVRSDEQAFINFGKGRTAAECLHAGCPAKYAAPSLAKVTWLKNPLNTKHRMQADMYGHAVDLLPAPYDWKALTPFTIMASAMMQASHELGIPIRWGADWDQDGKFREKGEGDNPHFELA